MTDYEHTTRPRLVRAVDARAPLRARLHLAVLNERRRIALQQSNGGKSAMRNLENHIGRLGKSDQQFRGGIAVRVLALLGDRHEGNCLSRSRSGRRIRLVEAAAEEV